MKLQTLREVSEMEMKHEESRDGAEVILTLLTRIEKLSEALKNVQCVYSSTSINGYIIEQLHLDDQCKKCNALSLYGFEVPIE